MTTTQAAAWTAIGTLALAGVTLAAIITTIVITAQDRHRDYIGPPTPIAPFRRIPAVSLAGTPTSQMRKDGRRGVV